MNDGFCMEICELIKIIESLQAQLEKSEKGRLEGVELYNKYIVLCHEKSKRLHELEAQLAETRLERNMQEANKNHYKAQLAESQRREKAAVRQRDCMSCYNRECQEYRNETAGGCPEWRGLQEAEKGESNA